MEVDFDFSPTRVTMCGEHLDLVFVILLSGKEVGVDEGPSLVIAEAVDSLGIFAGPEFHAAHLLGARDSFAAVRGIDGGLKMIGQHKDEVHGAGRRGAQSSQQGGGQDLPCVD